jgi:hypothetical protein
MKFIKDNSKMQENKKPAPLIREAGFALYPCSSVFS